MNNEHQYVFEGSECLQNFELRLHIDESVTPIQQPIRRIPFHTQQKVDNELLMLVGSRHIEPVTDPTTWLNPIVPVPKADGSIRLS